MAEAAKIKVHKNHLHLSPPIQALQSTFIHPLKTLASPRDGQAFLPSRFRGFPHLKGWAEEALKSRVQKEKLGGHRSFEDSDKEMHPEWGGWDAPRRPEACKFTGGVGGGTPWGRQRMLPVQEWGQTDNPQEQGGIFAGDAGGRELGSAEL